MDILSEINYCYYDYEANINMVSEEISTLDYGAGLLIWSMLYPHMDDGVRSNSSFRYLLYLSPCASKDKIIIDHPLSIQSQITNVAIYIT